LEPNEVQAVQITKLIVEGGKVDEKTSFQIGGQAIPRVTEQPVKSLGRWYDSTTRDTVQGRNLKQTAGEGLLTIDKTKLQRKFTVWVLQFMLIPKMMWPLLVYEIGLSTVEAIERLISKYIRKWLGLPPGLSTVGLYSRSAKLKLPLRAITEEFQVGKARLQMILSYSQDPVIRQVNPKLRSGRKWKASEAVARAEEAAKLKEVIGATQCNRQGVGYGKDKQMYSSGPKHQIRRSGRW